ncbi:MAG: OmpH family outer membrane protein [Chitinophagaceae bacterium]
MKNGLLIWNVVLTLVVAYLLVNVFTSKSKNDTAPPKIMAHDSASSSGFRIAYFEMDSIENNLEMVKTVKAEIAKKDDEYNGEVSKLDMIYRREGEKRMQNVKSQADMDAAQNEMKSVGEQLKAQKQDLDQKYQDYVMRLNLGVKKKIEDFLARYNQTKNYSYIVSYEQGLFYYKDTAYNITSDVIRGLNEEYKNEKK